MLTFCRDSIALLPTRFSFWKELSQITSPGKLGSVHVDSHCPAAHRTPPSARTREVTRRGGVHLRNLGWGAHGRGVLLMVFHSLLGLTSLCPLSAGLSSGVLSRLASATHLVCIVAKTQGHLWAANAQGMGGQKSNGRATKPSQPAFLPTWTCGRAHEGLSPLNV